MKGITPSRPLGLLQLNVVGKCFQKPRLIVPFGTLLKLGEHDDGLPSLAKIPPMHNSTITIPTSV